MDRRPPRDELRGSGPLDGPRDDRFSGGDPLTVPFRPPMSEAPTAHHRVPEQASPPWSAVTADRASGPPTGTWPPAAQFPAPHLQATPFPAAPQQAGPQQFGAPRSGPPFPASTPPRPRPPLSGALPWPPPDVSGVAAPHPPTYDVNAAAAPTYSGTPAFLPGHPTAPDLTTHVTEQIPTGIQWPPGTPTTPGPTARGTARADTGSGAGTGPRGTTATVGDVCTVLGGAAVLAFSVLPFVSYTDERFVAVASRTDLPTSWTAWSPSTFLAPLSWVAVLASVLAAVLGVLRVLDRGHRSLFGLPVGHVRVLLAGASSLILSSLAVAPKTVLFGDDEPQLTAAGKLVDSTLSLAGGGYLMVFAAFVALAGAALTARGRGGPVVWPLPHGVRTMFAKRTPDQNGTPEHPRSHYPQPHPQRPQHPR